LQRSYQLGMIVIRQSESINLVGKIAAFCGERCLVRATAIRSNPVPPTSI